MKPKTVWTFEVTVAISESAPAEVRVFLKGVLWAALAQLIREPGYEDVRLAAPITVRKRSDGDA